MDIKKILKDPDQRRDLIQGVVNFCCRLEGHEHEIVVGSGEGKMSDGHLAAQTDPDSCDKRIEKLEKALAGLEE